MYWIHVIIASIFFEALFINSIHGNVIRRRRQQTAGSLYENSNLGANQPAAGYNYRPNTNFYGTNLNNNQASKDLYGNPMVPPNTGNTLNNVGLNNQQQQQQQQQQQLYGVGNQPSVNPTGIYSASGINPLNTNIAMRDGNGNPLQPGAGGSSLYPSSNPQMGYQANQNPSLTNKDLYSQQNPNNNQYGYQNNLYPNSNAYGQMPNNNNNNNVWPNNNNNNQFNTNRDLTPNANHNTNNNAYSNPNSAYFGYNTGHQIMTSSFILFLSFLAIIFFHN